MRKGVVSLVLILIVSISLASAQSIDDPIRKMTHYAEEYEIGTINYAQLIVYLASLSKELATEMGAASQDHDPVLKKAQLEKALGTSTESTRWVWAERDQQERKLPNEVDAWRKIIFDGEKMQIHLSAWPTIREVTNEETIVYRLHHDITFKNPEETIDIKREIDDIQSLAEDYAAAPDRTKLESLAKASVTAEQLFNNNPDKNAGKCDELMNDLFGSENTRGTQKILRQEIDFVEGDTFEAKLQLELCDECDDWHWINMNLRFDARGRFPYPEEQRSYNQESREQYLSLSNEAFEEKTRTLLAETKTAIDNQQYQEAMDTMQELRILTEAWNEKANNPGKELEQQYRVDFESMTEEKRKQCEMDYCWIKADQARIQAEKELKKKNYEDRKQFYLTLFADYPKKEFYSSQNQWEKWLIRQFKVLGEEICDNNQDDNTNGQIDCADARCGGKVCGQETVTLEDENNTRQEQRTLYCIANTCQAKQELATINRTACGNNICEEGELLTCATDCTACPVHEAIVCEGTVLFSGQDVNGCPLAPTCVTEDRSCELDSECADPLCGDASCVEGTCQLAQLTECREPECTDGAEKIQGCATGETLVTETCIEGLWKSTELQCEAAQGDVQESTEDVVGNACVVKSDCGKENDVCSNGRCVTLPERVQEDVSETPEEIPVPEEAQESQALPAEGSEVPSVETNNDGSEESTLESSEQETPLPETEQSDAPLTGNVIFTFFASLINGFAVEGETGEGEGGSEGDTGSEEPVQESPPANPETNEPERNEEQERQEQQEREQEERETRDNEERERRSQECGEQCGRDCYNWKARNRIEQEIREQCGPQLECNVDEVRAAAEAKFASDEEVTACVAECSDKCLAGEETWVEPEREEHKEEQFVFTVGGACRQEQERREESIWFGGWGQEFNDFHLIKQQYYTNGANDWCQREYDNLLIQRAELESSLNEDFASWFFEEYVASAADDWENLEGIFNLYWRDVDLSRQLAEKAQCLGTTELPPHTLITIEYETDYGRIKFWEEVKTVPLAAIDGRNDQESPDVSIISPYMETYFFPSREFFKREMREAMETHRMPGPNEGEVRNTPSPRQQQRMREEGAEEHFAAFREQYGENIVIQFKDYTTNEIAFAIYVRLDEATLLYFEPRLPTELPPDAVTIEMSVGDLLDIIEYGETGHVELWSPQWDKKPEVGVVKQVTDGVKMYFMFRSMLNSAIVTPEAAESEAMDVTRLFFEVALGDGDHDERPDIDDEEFQKELEEERDAITGNVVQR